MHEVPTTRQPRHIADFLAFGHLRRIVSIVEAHSHALSLSAFNQFVSAGSSFILGLVLVRCLPAEEFGLYGIGLSACLLLAGVANAVLLTQMAVRLPDMPSAERTVYAAHMFVATLALCIFALLATALAMTLAGFVRASFSGGGLVLAVASASSAHIVRELFVRIAYTSRVERRALAITSSVAAFLGAVVAIGYIAGVQVCASAALWLYAGAHGVGAATGALVERLPVGLVRPRHVLRHVREAWLGGKWALGGVCVTWLQSQSFTAVTALVAGSGAVGRLNAARLLISPVMFMLPAINQVTMPRLVALRARDPNVMVRVGVGITTGLVLLAIAYSAAVHATLEWSAAVLLGEATPGLRAAVFVWCVYLLLALLRDGATTLLQAARSFRALALINALSAAISIAAAYLLIRAIGPVGAVLGTAIGDGVLALLLWRIVLDARSRTG